MVVVCVMQEIVVYMYELRNVEHKEVTVEYCDFHFLHCETSNICIRFSQ